MAMVLEEESNMDTSSIMMSQSRIMSVSQHTSNRKKFVYRAEDQPVDVDENSSSEDDSADEADLENQLLSFDKEEADIIRNINKGSLHLRSHQSALLNKTYSPTMTKRHTTSDHRATMGERQFAGSEVTKRSNFD